MPDQNVAESLQRLPGVQIDRAGGEGTAVLIDGLRQNLTTLNGDLFLTGREFYVSGEASGGGAGSNSQYGSLEGIPERGHRRYRRLQESPGLDDRGWHRRHHRPQDARPAGAAAWADRAAVTCRDSIDQPERAGWTPDATLVGSYKFNDRFAVTGSFSYDDEKTLDQGVPGPESQPVADHQFRHRSVHRAAEPLPTSRQLPATGPTVAITPNRSWPISPTINDERKIYGASFGVAAQDRPMRSRAAGLVLLATRMTSAISYTDKAWFNGQGDHCGRAASGYALPIRRHQPTRSTPTAWSSNGDHSMPTAPRPRRSTSTPPPRPTICSGRPASTTAAR